MLFTEEVYIKVKRRENLNRGIVQSQQYTDIKKLESQIQNDRKNAYSTF